MNAIMRMPTTMALALTLWSERNYKTELTPWKKRMQTNGIRMLSRNTRSLSLSKPTIVLPMSSVRPTELWLSIAIL
jgi:fructose-specific phosphotransferase system IIC component